MEASDGRKTHRVIDVWMQRKEQILYKEENGIKRISTLSTIQFVMEKRGNKSRCQMRVESK